MKYKDLENEWSQHWFQFIKNNLDKPWNWNLLSQNLNLTSDIVRDNPDKSWDWYFLIDNPNISWAVIESNLIKEWDWRLLSQFNTSSSNNDPTLSNIIATYPDKCLL